MPNYPYYTEPAHVQGVVTQSSGNAARDTANASTEGRLVRDVADKISLLSPNIHPLVTFLTNIGRTWDGSNWSGSGLMKKETGSPTFEWLEDVYGGRYAKVAGTGYAASGAVTITVSGAGSTPAYIFTVGDVIRNAISGENMLVATIASSTTITVAAAGRAFGSTAAAAGNSTDDLFIIGNVNEEGSAARNANTTVIANPTNYTQIFKTSIPVTGTENESTLYGGPDLRYQRAKKGTEHLTQIESAFWFGEKKTDTGGTMGKPRRATGGILELITTGGSFVQNQGGVLTAPDFNNFLREGFTYGSTKKILFAGGNVLQAVNEFSRGQLVTKNGDTTYGVKISEVMTAFGTVTLVHNPLFVAEYAGYGFLVDLDCLKYRYMHNRDTVLKMNVQAPDVDGVIDQYISECGLERQQAPRHALLKGVLAA